MTKTKFVKNKAGMAGFENAIDFAMEKLSIEATGKVLDITPRDLKRPPKNLNAKVTGSLKRSIGYERSKKFKYKVGSKMGAENSISGKETNTYGFHLEFGTKHMKPRSFLRKGIFDNINYLQNFFAYLLKNKMK